MFYNLFVSLLVDAIDGDQRGDDKDDVLVRLDLQHVVVFAHEGSQMERFVVALADFVSLSIVNGEVLVRQVSVELQEHFSVGVGTSVHEDLLITEVVLLLYGGGGMSLGVLDGVRLVGVHVLLCDVRQFVALHVVYLDVVTECQHFAIGFEYILSLAVLDREVVSAEALGVLVESVVRHFVEHHVGND